MSEQMQPQANQKWHSRFGVLIGFGAGIGSGPWLSFEAASLVMSASLLAATVLYYRRIRFDA